MILKMRSRVLICTLVTAASACLLSEAVMAQCSDSIQSPTYGKPASKFVSGCEIYFKGEYLEPIKGPDGTMGFLIEKTDSAVTLNGRHYYSPNDPPRKRVRPISEKIKRRGVIIERTKEEIRRLAIAHDSLGKAYYINNTLYMDNPQTYVTEYGDTVMLSFSKGEAKIVYANDASLIFELHPGPIPPKEELDKRYLDNVYKSLCEIRPGYIILIGRGYKMWYPLSSAPALKAALADIPRLAQPRQIDLYGEWIYEMLKIDEFTFDTNIIRDFIGK